MILNATSISRAAAGARKPDLEFFNIVLADAGLNPSKTVFVDDKIENVEAGRSLGLHGLVYTDAASFIQSASLLFPSIKAFTT